MPHRSDMRDRTQVALATARPHKKVITTTTTTTKTTTTTMTTTTTVLRRAQTGCNDPGAVDPMLSPTPQELPMQTDVAAGGPNSDFSQSSRIARRRHRPHMIVPPYSDPRATSAECPACTVHTEAGRCAAPAPPASALSHRDTHRPLRICNLLPSLPVNDAALISHLHRHHLNTQTGPWSQPSTHEEDAYCASAPAGLRTCCDVSPTMMLWDAPRPCGASHTMIISPGNHEEGPHTTSAGRNGVTVAPVLEEYDLVDEPGWGGIPPPPYSPPGPSFDNY